MRTVLLTGATGFVGAAVAPALAAAGWAVRADARRLAPDADWSDALAGASAVVHLAARAHRLEDGAAQADEYRRVNAEATGTLGRAAAAAGARLVFLSSVKAVGEATAPGRPWNEDSPCLPEDAYGSSKLDAERRLAAVPGLSWCALRAPLVYGPGVKANFLRMTSAVDRGLPLPFASIENRRSLLYVGNLASAVVRCLDVPAATGPFFIRDGEDLSTPELLRRLAKALGRPPRLFPCPAWLLRAGATLLGRGAEAERLLGDLAVDDARLRAALSWTPPFSVDEGLAAVARWYPGGPVKRLFDIVASAGALVLLSPALVVVALAVKLTSKGPALYWSDRVGRGNVLFPMPKFRTMRTDTPEVATHLLAGAGSYLTPVGAFLRRTSLDELPQLWCVLKGDMSLVGPRPALHNQHDLVALRTEKGVPVLTPGVTGWAQINGRDDLPIPVKVAFDAEYLARRGLLFDLVILWRTVFKVAKAEGVKH